MPAQHPAPSMPAPRCENLHLPIHLHVSVSQAQEVGEEVFLSLPSWMEAKMQAAKQAKQAGSYAYNNTKPVCPNSHG